MNGTLESPPNRVWLPAHITHRPPYIDHQDPQHNVKALRRLRKSHLLFEGAAQRTTTQRLTHWVIFGTTGGAGKTRDQADQKRAGPKLQQTISKHSTDNPALLLGAKSALWSRANKKSGNWYREVVDAAGCFMTKWHRTEADKSWLIQATVGTKNSNKGKLEEGGGRAGGRTDTGVDERRIEMVHGVASYRFDFFVERVQVLWYSPKQYSER